ncbi:DUF5625 family protein [Arsenophonus apicola]|uniref:DUF5625 family protein n=1 Tax=Arsenophonus apicola TaxID=2879119 RepID=A0ABY8P157_9GAMM|nr:DUF5625 family protein [Arsenophonus apicola]WGO83218.1 DUF5625 family protein [Arsenophonus apicola]
MLLFSSVWLVACNEYIDIYRPIDIARAGQSVMVEFEIKKQGGYLFALLFETGEGHDELERRFKLFGSINKVGVVIPISLRIVKDDQIFFDETINTKGTDGGQAFDYQERRLNTAVRDIKSFSLSPGRYSVVITTLEDVALFNGIESFVNVAYYEPKI